MPWKYKQWGAAADILLECFTMQQSLWSWNSIWQCLVINNDWMGRATLETSALKPRINHSHKICLNECQEKPAFPVHRYCFRMHARLGSDTRMTESTWLLTPCPRASTGYLSCVMGLKWNSFGFGHSQLWPICCIMKFGWIWCPRN